MCMPYIRRKFKGHPEDIMVIMNNEQLNEDKKFYKCGSLFYDKNILK